MTDRRVKIKALCCYSVLLIAATYIEYDVYIQTKVPSRNSEELRIETAKALSPSPRPNNNTNPHKEEQPVLKIFVMAGQSNTQGEGLIDAMNDDGSFRNGTLEWMVETHPETYGKLKTNTGGASSWTERDDIWITFNRQNKNNVEAEINQHGKLVAGFGGGPGYEAQKMGPELGFGWTIGDAMATNNNGMGIEVLLIKIAWGGRNLAQHFRPPSSGGKTGLYYEGMLANIRKTLSELSDLVPGYNPNSGYELEGFVWHQGWSDGRKSKWADEYESNMVNFIKDVRADLGVPKLPVVIGVSGMKGWTIMDDDDPKNTVIKAQFAVADASLHPELFEGTVASVETRDFYRDLESSPGKEIYHWNNNCESYWWIGRAMGEAMIDLVRAKQKRET